MSFLNTLPVAVDAAWAAVNGGVVPVMPDSVDWFVDGPATIAADPMNPTGRAIVTPDAGAVGPFTVSAISHQVGLSDFSATPISDEFVNPPPPQINSGTLTFEPQVGGTVSSARGVRRR